VTSSFSTTRRAFIGGAAAFALHHGFDLLAQDMPKRACILLWMEGGPSQLDTFDPKPGRPTGGSFRAIDTALRGAQFSEHLPGLAKRADRLCVVRSVTGAESDHLRATQLLQTGRRPTGLVEHPAIGSVVAHFRGGSPGYVQLRSKRSPMTEVERTPGFLAPATAPFVIAQPDRPDALLRQLDARTNDRAKLLDAMNADFRAEHPNDNSDARAALFAAARALKDSPVERALDLRGEKPETIRAYLGLDAARPLPREGAVDSQFGYACLVARRLVEAGVPFVEVLMGGWDTHGANFKSVEYLSRLLDPAFSALLDDLARTGLLDSTVVAWMGEFGRTPWINAGHGRDHYPRAFSAVLAGAGAARGRVVGVTDDDGIEIVRDPVAVPELFATVVHLLGVDPSSRYAVAEHGVRAVADARPVKMLSQ
jgi:hypothetical protein